MSFLEKILKARNRLTPPFGGSLEVLKQNIKKPDYQLELIQYLERFHYVFCLVDFDCTKQLRQFESKRRLPAQMEKYA